MIHGTIRLRPTRLAFLIPYGDKVSLLQAIRTNSFLWGGQYNPIIPIFTHRPSDLPEYLMKAIVDEGYLNHYLENFDPDLVVPLGECESRTFNTRDREILPVTKVLLEVERFRVPHNGIGLFEILNHYASHEDRYVSRQPKRILMPKFTRRESLFLSAVFGQLPSELEAILTKDYLSYFQHETPECNIDNYTEFFPQQNLFLRRLTAYQIEPGMSLPCLFLLDATDFLDVVDYWNLRALGLNVFPVAKQAASGQKIMDSSLGFINDHYKSERYPWGISHATLYHGHGFSFEDSMGFAESLGVPARSPAPEAKIGFSYLPPMGEFGFENYIKPWVRAPIVKEARFSSVDATGVAIKVVSPDFVSYPGVTGEHRFANEIELTTYHQTELMAEVIPEGRNVLALSFGGYDFTNWKFSKGKCTYLATFADDTLNLKRPLAEDVFFRWFQNSDFKASISQAGRIAKQVSKNLGGIPGLWLLAHEQIFDLIKRLNWRPRKSDGAERNVDESKDITHPELIGKLKKLANQSEILSYRNPDDVLRKLLDAKILQLGIKVNCSFCNQPSWYSIDEVSYESKCVNCLQQFPLPTHSPEKNLTWSYRTIGAFSPAAQSYGSYAVLLALGFFATTLNGRTTPMFGLEIRAKDDPSKDSVPDIDLILFFRQNSGFIKKPDLVFVDCKTYTHGFEQKNIDNMKRLALGFPESYFVFATLEKSLNSSEKELISSFITFLKEGSDNTNVPTNVMVLTGLELYSNKEPPRCWEGQIEPLSPTASNFSFISKGLKGLCDLTQEAHLAFMLPPSNDLHEPVPPNL